MKVLIIGGMGVIGGAITEAAVKKEYDVTIVSRRELLGKWADMPIHGIQGNWKSESFAREVLKANYDVIVDTQIFNKSHIKRTMQLIEGHCKQFIYISTDSVYIHPGENISENTLINTRKLRWSYGKEKRIAELYLEKNIKQYSYYFTCIRPTLTFGETRIPVGFSSKRGSFTLVERLIKEKPIVVFGGFDEKHSLCHVSTLGTAVADCFLNKLAENKFFHIADDNSYSYREIFEIIEEKVGKRGHYVCLPTFTLKKFDYEKYEEMIYDKDPSFTLDCAQIKEVSPETNYCVDIRTVMNSILEYLESKKGDERDDMNYELLTDLLLLRHNACIVDDLMERDVRSYLDSLNPNYVDEIVTFERAVKRKNWSRLAIYLTLPLRNVLRPIKNRILYK